jgi:CO/xanthine dehydrogenase FAD-binding subunit
MRSARIVVGGVEDVPRRATGAEAVLAGAALGDAAVGEAAALAAQEVEPVSDLHATAGHRRELTEVLTRRALGEVTRRWRTGA